MIGTLRASGYTRGELVRHYLSMPVIVTILAACVGNILGYTVFKNVVVGMYYNSYSLPTYETICLPKWLFFARFRLRIMIQNSVNYLVLFVGIFFIMVMLAMAVGMPAGMLRSRNCLDRRDWRQPYRHHSAIRFRWIRHSKT